MPKFSKSSKFYQLNYIGQSYEFLANKLRAADFLHVDNTEQFYLVGDDHIKLANFLIGLHNKRVNWLLTTYNTPEILLLYKEFQICQQMEEIGDKEHELLHIFNCNVVRAMKAFKGQLLFALQ
jgi:hypothetical protein